MIVLLLALSTTTTTTMMTTTTRRLAPCPASPNCVSTLAADPKKLMPALVYELSEEEVMERIEEEVQSSARARVVERDGLYLRAEFTSLVFRFVDDVELLLDPEARRIHFRSASRVGRSDLGANRRRMEKLTERLAALDGIRVEPVD